MDFVLFHESITHLNIYHDRQDNSVFNAFLTLYLQSPI